MLAGIGGDQTMQVQMPIVMVVAVETIKTVAVVAVMVVDLGKSMPTPKFHIKSI